jgi:hypothetical protein
MKASSALLLITLTFTSAYGQSSAAGDATGWNGELITAVCGLFVAVLALGTTIWTLFVTRKHNIQSVRPHLKFERFAIAKEDTSEAGILLKNDGIGPALISSISIEFDGDTINYSRGVIKEKIKLLELKNLYSDGQTIVESGSVVGVNASEYIIHLIFKGPIHSESIYKKLIRFNMHIHYESFHKEKYCVELNSDLKA